jgi:hypothetical protein
MRDTLDCMDRFGAFTTKSEVYTNIRDLARFELFCARGGT